MTLISLRLLYFRLVCCCLFSQTHSDLCHTIFQGFWQSGVPSTVVFKIKFSDIHWDPSTLAEFYGITESDLHYIWFRSNVQEVVYWILNVFSCEQLGLAGFTYSWLLWLVTQPCCHYSTHHITRLTALSSAFCDTLILLIYTWYMGFYLIFRQPHCSHLAQFSETVGKIPQPVEKGTQSSW